MAQMAAPALMLAGTAMNIIGASNQAGAQRAAGNAAYQNALMRAQMAKTQADQEYENASTIAGAGQVQAQRDRDQGTLLAGRAKAVMAASGAGVDDKLVAGLAGQGNYNASVDEFNANDKARNLRNQGAMDIYSANAGIYSGEQTRANDYTAADNTITGAVGKGLLSFASYYGGGAFGGGGGDSYTTLSPSDTMAAYSSMPKSFTMPGFDSIA